MNLQQRLNLRSALGTYLTFDLHWEPHHDYEPTVKWWQLGGTLHKLKLKYKESSCFQSTLFVTLQAAAFSFLFSAH